MSAPATFYNSTTTGKHHTSTSTLSAMNQMMNSTNEPKVVYPAPFNNDFLDPVLRNIHHDSVFGADAEHRVSTLDFRSSLVCMSKLSIILLRLKTNDVGEHLKTLNKFDISRNAFLYPAHLPGGLKIFVSFERPDVYMTAAPEGVTGFLRQ